MSSTPHTRLCPRKILVMTSQVKMRVKQSKGIRERDVQWILESECTVYTMFLPHHLLTFLAGENIISFSNFPKQNKGSTQREREKIRNEKQEVQFHKSS